MKIYLLLPRMAISPYFTIKTFSAIIFSFSRLSVIFSEEGNQFLQRFQTFLCFLHCIIAAEAETDCPFNFREGQTHCRQHRAANLLLTVAGRAGRNHNSLAFQCVQQYFASEPLEGHIQHIGACLLQTVPVQLGIGQG